MSNRDAIVAILKQELPAGIPSTLPPAIVLSERDPAVPHAPKRVHHLNETEKKQALANALRYFPAAQHAELVKDFSAELELYGHIYMYRFRPTSYVMQAYPLDYYPTKHPHGAAILAMLMNNLDNRVAMYPHELITYGGNGSVLSNWIQFRLLTQYLCEMSDEQTLALYSGHPAGLFPSPTQYAPRLVITNGMMIPNYSTRYHYDRLYAMGVTQYGQMTAGSFCYIGPQGIVHGTTITIMNAGRKYLGVESLEGKVVVTSGLGGMSGAQAKAGTICNAVTVVAEVDPAALYKRKAQGWLLEAFEDVEALIVRIKEARAKKEATSIGYLGNIVTLWERLEQEPELIVDLGSDQTSCHDPFGGGYYPVQLSFAEGKKMLAEDPAKFKTLVQESLRRQVTAINKLTARGMRFWDYGNSFLAEASRAGAEVWAPEDKVRSLNHFRYPSYVQDIMGDIFSLGFGPFRWCCLSQDPADLDTTDRIAAETVAELEKKATEASAAQFRDNYKWIVSAKENKLVVGSQCRILYVDCAGRTQIALRFNEAIAKGIIKAPIVISRDHHDVSGTDSPFRETSNIEDGSALCADMSIHNVIGDSFRGATWVAIHNGGGTGWGEASNGGFGLVLDGTEDAARRAEMMLHWDVLNGVNRRSWAGNSNAIETIRLAMEQNPNLKVTLPTPVDPKLLA